MFRREGLPSGDDVFSGVGIIEGQTEGVLTASGTNVGSYIYGEGTLTITFDDGVAGSDVNSIIQAIRYGNLSDNPPDYVEIQWVFVDGNLGDQGTGGALSASGSTLVQIRGVNDPPLFLNTPEQAFYVEDQNYLLSSISLSDVDNEEVSLSLKLSDPSVGSITTPTLRGLLPIFDENSGEWSILGNKNDVNELLTYVAFVPKSNYSGSFSLVMEVSDGVASPVVDTVAFTGLAVNGAPTGSVTISGTATQGQTLTAANTVADPDGLGAITYTWKAGGATVGTGSTYTLTQAEVGKTVTVTASYTDAGNTAESVTSDPTLGVLLLPTEGMVYHWKSHALLDKVDVHIMDSTAVAETPAQPFDLRAATFDAAAGRLSVELWVNPMAPAESLDFTVTGPAGATLGFTSALGMNWTSLNSLTSGQLTVGAYLSNLSAAGLTVPTRIGILDVESADGTAELQVGFSDIQVGEMTVPDLGLALAGAVTGADGAFAFSTLPAGSYGLSATRPAGDGSNGVTSADALAALRLAVGINPNTDPDGAGPQEALKVSPYQFMAADANQDGKVSAADALAILRMAVKLPTAVPQEWFFVEETRDLWNETTGQSALTRTNAAWDRSISATAPGEVNLVGVLKGDVNGSWIAPTGAQDLDVLEPGYFADLAQRISAPMDQFGVYSGG